MASPSSRSTKLYLLHYLPLLLFPYIWYPPVSVEFKMERQMLTPLEIPLMAERLLVSLTGASFTDITYYTLRRHEESLILNHQPYHSKSLTVPHYSVELFPGIEGRNGETRANYNILRNNAHETKKREREIWGSRNRNHWIIYIFLVAKGKSLISCLLFIISSTSVYPVIYFVCFLVDSYPPRVSCC